MKQLFRILRSPAKVYQLLYELATFNNVDQVFGFADRAKLILFGNHKRRRVEVWRNHRWEKETNGLLGVRKGEKFRMFEPSGAQCKLFECSEAIAAEDGHENKDMPGTGTLEADWVTYEMPEGDSKWKM